MLSFLFLMLSFAGQFVNAGAQAAHNTTHRLEIKEKVGMGICSSTSIGKHRILTATHCEKDGLGFRVDGKPVTVVSVLRDGADHSIMVFSDITFGEYAAVNADALRQGDHVYMWGNPDGMHDQYREGYVTGVILTPTGPITTLDLNGYFGDSGSGLFNESGQVVGVVSIINNTSQEEGGPMFKLMGAYPLRFTDTQLNESH